MKPGKVSANEATVCNWQFNRQPQGRDGPERPTRSAAPADGRPGLLLRYLMVGWLVVTATSGAWAGPTNADLMKIKAAFLLNFVKFIQWPQEAFASEDAPIVIGVLGDDELAEVAAKTVQGVQLDGRRLVVQSFAFPAIETMDADRRRSALVRFRQRIGGCHLAFLASNHLEHTRMIHDLMPAPHVVLVSDGKRGVHRGAMLAIEREGDRIVFYGNPDAVEASPVRMSSKLLQLARPIESEE